MSNKLHLSVLCGGQSAEHEVSLMSAKNIVAALDPQKYTITIIYISHEGHFYLIPDHQLFLEHGAQKCLQQHQAIHVTALLGENQHAWVALHDATQRFVADCVFPVLHGTYGEDGIMQGLLDLMNLPYVGSNVLSSAICMEKHITKQLLRAAGLPTGDWVALTPADVAADTYDEVTRALGQIVFIKPVSLGSSIGISKVKNQAEFDQAVRLAFQYDQQIIIEKFIPGREIEVSVLGNENPVASLPGEIITKHEFYSFDAKYVDPEGAEAQTPAKLSDAVVKDVQAMALAAFKVLHCSGMARVDFFVNDDSIMINEVNPLPGFTNISMYPKNWEASGVAYAELLDDLIDLALVRYKQERMVTRRRLAELDMSSQLSSPASE